MTTAFGLYPWLWIWTKKYNNTKTFFYTAIFTLSLETLASVAMDYANYGKSVKHIIIMHDIHLPLTRGKNSIFLDSVHFLLSAIFALLLRNWIPEKGTTYFKILIESYMYIKVIHLVFSLCIYWGREQCFF